MTDTFASLRVEQTSTVARVADELRRAIFDGELGGGVALREKALTDQLGVSRSTVREALGRLVADGLAVRETHRGVTVASPTADAVRQICAARLVLEGAGIRHWPDASAAAKKWVRDSLGAYVDGVAAGAGYAELNRLHLAFHLSLVALTGNDRLTAMAESMMNELKVALAQVDRIKRNAHDQAADHTELVVLLDADRIDDAHAFIVDHLADAEQEILAALGL